MTRTVLITGAAVRVGRAIALAMADNGWNVAIHYHTSEAAARALASEIEEKRRTAHLVRADLCDADAVSGIMPALVKQGVVPDCLINNASAFEKDTLANYSDETLRPHMAVNFFASLQLIRDFAHYYQGTAGNIINIVDGMKGGSMSPAFLTYTLSKMALANVTSLLVKELAPKIRINAVAPGPTITGKQDTEETFAKLRQTIPLERTSDPQEIIDAIFYLLGAPAVTGQIISLAGGV